MSDRLLAIAAANDGILASEDVARADVDANALAALVRASVLHRVRRGAYVVATEWTAAAPEKRLDLRTRAVLRTRKGLDWTAKFQAIADEAAGMPDCIIDSEIVALNSEGHPDFAALQAALSDGKTDRLICFVFDLLFADGEDLRGLPLGDRKQRLKDLLAKARGRRKEGLIRYVTDRPGHDFRYEIDPSRAEAALDWKAPHDFETGLARTIDWYLDNRAWWEKVRAARYAGQRLGQAGGQMGGKAA